MLGQIKKSGIKASVRKTFDSLPAAFHGASLKVPEGTTAEDLLKIDGVQVSMSRLCYAIETKTLLFFSARLARCTHPPSRRCSDLRRCRRRRRGPLGTHHSQGSATEPRHSQHLRLQTFLDHSRRSLGFARLVCEAFKARSRARLVLRQRPVWAPCTNRSEPGP